MANQRIHNTKKALKLGYQFTLSRQASLLVLPPLSSISNFQGLSTMPWSALNPAVPPNPTNIPLVTQSGPRVSGDQTQRVGKSPRFQMDSLFETQPARTHTTILASFFAKRTGQQAHERRVNQWAVLSIEDSQRLWCILWMEAKLRSALGVNSPQIPQHCRLQSFRKWYTFCAEPFVTRTLHKDV